MRRFSKKAIVDAIGAAFRSPFPRSPARPQRRKPLFEALEPRIMLSSEVPVIPPPPLQGEVVLSAPLEFGNDTGSIQVQQQGPQRVQFQDDWGSVDLEDAPGGAGLILDFSEVSADLQFEIFADGSASVSDGVNQVNAAHVIELIGGAGDDSFRFEALPDEPLAIETGGRGTDRLDFSALTEDLTYVTHTDGTVTVRAGASEVTVDRAVAMIGGQGQNVFVEEKAPVIAGTLSAGAFSEQAAQLSIAAYVATQPAPKQIVIVDSAVEDYRSLLGSLPALVPSQATAEIEPDAEADADLLQGDATPSTSAAAADTLIIVLDAG